MRRRLPIRAWVAIAVAVAVVVLAVNVITARAEFCGSCHSAMGEHYRSFSGSTHASVATCLDCHSEPGWVGYYHSKMDGVRNALAYFFHVPRGEACPPPGPAACLRPGCHSGDALSSQPPGAETHRTHIGSVACVDCHGDVGHRLVGLQRTVKDCAACHAPPAAAPAGSAQRA